MSIILGRNLLVFLFLLFLAIVFLRKNQNLKNNWSIFYGALYVAVLLLIINYLCVEYELWLFTPLNQYLIQLPLDIYFIWVVVWGVMPALFFKGRYLVIIALILFWLDIVLMPELDKIGLIKLNKYWVIGETIMIILVFIPSYLWVKFSYENKFNGLRSIFQVLIMGLLFFVCLPFLLFSYGLQSDYKIVWSPYQFQILLIIIFPALTAVLDLVNKGQGTPFPYDSTTKLVRTGVYAYCRNPIQWSFTLIFVSLSYYHSSYYMLIGSIVSIAYSFGVSNFQEYDDMKKRFGEDWVFYKKNVPKWRFLWRPKNIPNGTIYFDANCDQCNQLYNWFSKSKAINLKVKYSSEFKNNHILQATYIDHNGVEFKSVSALACSMEHINLMYASLAWFMRFPLINYILQAIVNSMNFPKKKNCKY